MTKTITAALIAAAFALPATYALAAPQHNGGGHAPSMPTNSMPSNSSMPMNQDSHGDAVSSAAQTARTDDTNVGKAVSPVANDKNKGKHMAKGKGHTKTHGKH